MWLDIRHFYFFCIMLCGVVFCFCICTPLLFNVYWVLYHYSKTLAMWCFNTFELLLWDLPAFIDTAVFGFLYIPLEDKRVKLKYPPSHSPLRLLAKPIFFLPPASPSISLVVGLKVVICELCQLTIQVWNKTNHPIWISFWITWNHQCYGLFIHISL